MIRAVYIQKKLSLYLLLPILFFCNSAISQSKNEILKKIEDLKLNPQFKRESPAHIDLLLNLSREYLYKNSDSLLIVLDQAYELSVETKYREGEARALHNYGYFYSQIGESEKALEYNLKSIEVANKYNVRPQKIYALNNIALDLWSKGKNAKALTYYLEALSIAKETKNIFMTAILNNNIALLYSDNGDFDTALKFHEKALEITNNKLGKDVLGSTLLNMAVIYIEQEKFELADSTTDKCIAIFENDNSIDWMSHSYEVKGSIALALNKFKDALFWYNKSKKICDDNDFTSGYTKTYAGLAEAYIGLKDFKKAEDYALKALKISKDLDVLETVKYTYSLLSEIYHAQRQYSVAYDYQAKYITLYEKSSKESFKKGLGVLRSEMKFENQKKQLIAKNNKALAEQKLYVYLAICALVAVSIFLIFMYRTHKLQKKHTKELLLRESELEASNTTKDKLFSIIAHDLKGPINSFYSLLKMYVSGNVSKEEADFILPKAFQEIGSISEMLNNLLIWGKTQLTATNNNPNNNDINLLINDNIALLSPIAKKKSIIIKNNVTDTIKGFYDKDQINIVIRNLLNNAIKFTNVGGKITVNALDNEDHIQVSVSDDGVGMDLETQTNLFNKNNYKTTYGTNNEKGTGLGLNLCQEMITVNDGVIWVTSVVNKGSTFSFKIPSKRSLKAVV